MRDPRRPPSAPRARPRYRGRRAAAASETGTTFLLSSRGERGGCSDLGGGLLGTAGVAPFLAGGWHDEGRPRAPGRAFWSRKEYVGPGPDSCFRNTSLMDPC